MLHSLLIDDALASLPSFLRPTMEVQRDSAQLSSTTRIRERKTELLREGFKHAEMLWRGLLAHDKNAVDACLAELEPHHLATCARWRYHADEGETACLGESLLHCAAYTGHRRLLELLIRAGGSVACVGQTSGCTPLHAAAAAGHAHVCKLLLETGGVATAAATSSKRSPLHLACSKLHAEAALVLVELGGADPYSTSNGSETPIALLRRKADESALELMAALERSAAKAESAGQSIVAGGNTPTETKDKSVEKKSTPALEEAINDDTLTLSELCADSDVDDEGAVGEEIDEHDYDEDEDEE